MKDSAIIVSLTISQWSGRKFDRQVTNEVDSNHGTDGAGRFNKLLVDKKSLASISSAAGKIRSFSYSRTHPWGDNGDRLLPAALFFDYTQGIRKLKESFYTEVDSLVDQYDHIISEAKHRLQDLYRPEEYPTKDEIRSKFNVFVGLQPLPAEDFRLGLVTESQMEDIRAQVANETAARHARAIESLYEQAKTMIHRMIVTLDDKDKVFRNSLIGNIEDFINVLPALNYVGDPKITALTDDLRSLIVDPDSLRVDPAVRNTYLERARKLDKMYF